MPLPPPVPREHLHTRSVTYRGYERADGLWEIEAELVDTKTYPIGMFERGELPPQTPIHHMTVRVAVDDDFVVREIATSMDDTPLAECQQAVPPMQGVLGAALGRGWRQAVDGALGGVQGCTHLRELLINLATAAWQTIPAGQQRRRGGGRIPDAPGGQPPFHLGRCITWDVDGPVVARHYPQFVGWQPLRRKDPPREPSAEGGPQA